MQRFSSRPWRWPSSRSARCVTLGADGVDVSGSVERPPPCHVSVRAGGSWPLGYLLSSHGRSPSSSRAALEGWQSPSCSARRSSCRSWICTGRTRNGVAARVESRLLRMGAGSPMPSPLWHQVLLGTDHLVLYPARPQCGTSPVPYEAPAYLAGAARAVDQRGESVWTRRRGAASAAVCHDLAEQVKAGAHRRPFVLHRAALGEGGGQFQSAAQTTPAMCEGAIDTLSVCVTATSVPALARPGRALTDGLADDLLVGFSPPCSTGVSMVALGLVSGLVGAGGEHPSRARSNGVTWEGSCRSSSAG